MQRCYNALWKKNRIDLFNCFIDDLLNCTLFCQVFKLYCWDKSGIYQSNWKNFCIYSLSIFLTHVVYYMYIYNNIILFYFFWIFLNIIKIKIKVSCIYMFSNTLKVYIWSNVESAWPHSGRRRKHITSKYICWYPVYKLYSKGKVF